MPDQVGVGGEAAYGGGIGDVAGDEVGARVLWHALALERAQERDPLDLAWARTVSSATWPSRRQPAASFLPMKPVPPVIRIASSLPPLARGR